MKGRVLVVDDDAALAEMLGIVLRGEGFEPTFVADGDKAVEVFRDSRPDLVLLDLMLPGSDGIDVCRQIRAESGVPIVMLTAKTDTVDVVLGLESGADDYIVKPFKSKELVARVRARLRRTDEPAPEMLQIGDIEVENRPEDEVTSFAGTPVAAPGSAAYNPAFDVTRAALVTALVTEYGIVRPVNAGTLHDLGTRRGPREGAPSDISVER